MSGDFLDSNVILYSLPPADPRNTTASESLARSLDGSGVISFQVVQEVLNVLLKRMQPRLSDNEIRPSFSDVLVPLWRVQPSRRLYERSLEIHERYAYSFYDSLIIA